MFMLYSHLFQGLAVPLDPAQSRFILAAENEWETNIDTTVGLDSEKRIFSEKMRKERKKRRKKEKRGKIGVTVTVVWTH